MAETQTIQNIYKELKDLKKDISFIKEHRVDRDTVLTPEERKRYEESMRELKESKTTSGSDLRKELGI